MFTFRRNYFLVCLLLFIIELIIAIWVKDDFVRPYLGDVIVIGWLYTLFRTFINRKAKFLLIITLFISFVIEWLQYVDFITFMGWAKNKVLRVILGTSFAWEDIICYLVGFIIVYSIEKWRKQI